MADGRNPSLLEHSEFGNALFSIERIRWSHVSKSRRVYVGLVMEMALLVSSDFSFSRLLKAIDRIWPDADAHCAFPQAVLRFPPTKKSPPIYQIEISNPQLPRSNFPPSLTKIYVYNDLLAEEVHRELGYTKVYTTFRLLVFVCLFVRDFFRNFNKSLLYFLFSSLLMYYFIFYAVRVPWPQNL